MKLPLATNPFNLGNGVTSTVKILKWTDHIAKNNKLFNILTHECSQPIKDSQL